MLLCLVCLFDLACFFLPSHLSFKNMYIPTTNFQLTFNWTSSGKHSGVLKLIYKTVHMCSITLCDDIKIILMHTMTR